MSAFLSKLNSPGQSSIPFELLPFLFETNGLHFKLGKILKEDRDYIFKNSVLKDLKWTFY